MSLSRTSNHFLKTIALFFIPYTEIGTFVSVLFFIEKLINLLQRPRLAQFVDELAVEVPARQHPARVIEVVLGPRVCHRRGHLGLAIATHLAARHAGEQRDPRRM